jgi:hypothetical protein
MNNHLSPQIINQTMNMTFEIQFAVCNRQAQKCSGVKLVKCSFRKMSLVTEITTTRINLLYENKFMFCYVKLHDFLWKIISQDIYHDYVTFLLIE